MATPNTAIGLSDVNDELTYPATTPRAFNDPIFRDLSGLQSRTIDSSGIGFSDVAGKAAFDGIIAPASNSVASYGGVFSTALVVASTDMYSPNVTWSYQVITGTQDVRMDPTSDRAVTLRLFTNEVGTAIANVAVTCTVAYRDHVIGTDTKYINLAGTIYNPALVITGPLTVNSSGYVAQSAVSTLTATSNVVGGVIQFIVNPGQGASINGNTITLTSATNVPGNDNNQTYSVTTNVLYQGNVVASNVQNINVRANFQVPDFVFAAPASSNNIFANNGPVNASLKITADHTIAGANIAWTASKVSGDDATLTTSANNQSANLTLAFNSGEFGTKKAIYDVLATLKYANGYVLNSKSTRLTLRTAAYGLSFNPASDQQTQGYNAQTAIATASASWQAGTFAWNTSIVSGAQANLVQAVAANSATITARVMANTIGTTSVSTVRINPSLSFDGFTMANTSSVTTLSAEFTNYTFTLTGPSTNNQIGAAPLNPRVLITANHTIANGTIVFSKTANDGVTMVNTALTANLSTSSNTLSINTTTLTAKLYDQFNRLVQSVDQPIALRTYVPNIQFIGANSVAASGYAPDQIAIAAITATAAPGSNTFALSPVKISGDTLTITDYTGNTVSDRVDLKISAQAGDIGTKSGLYRIDGTVTFFGDTYTASYNVAVTATLLNPNFTLVAANAVGNSFTPPATATGTVTATYTVPGGNIQWSTAPISGTLSSNTANSTVYSAVASQNTFGINSLGLTVTGTLLDANGLVVDSKSANVAAVANMTDPGLTITGANTVTNANVFTSVAATSLVASSVTGIPSLSYQWSYSLVSGTQPVIAISNTATTSTISLTNTAKGSGAVACVIDVTCKVLSAGIVLSTKVTRVSLSSTAQIPAQTFTPTNAALGDYNFPVNATASVVATQPAGGSITWDYAPASGGGAGVTIGGAQNGVWQSSQSQSAVGASQTTWNVVAHYWTPDGVLINSRSGQVQVYVQRYDPGFYLYYGQADGYARVATWAEDVNVTSILRAGWANMGGTISVGISATYAGGVGATPTYDNVNGICYLTLSNNRTNQGINEKNALYSVVFTLFRNGQQIAGPISAGLGCLITPYYIGISASPSTSVSNVNARAQINLSAYSNDPRYGGASWTYGRTSGNGTAGLGVATVPTSASIYQDPAAYITTLSGNYNVFATFNVDGAARTAGVGVFLSSQSTVNTGSGGGQCVASDMWLNEFFQASDIVKGMSFKTWNPEDEFAYHNVQAALEPMMQECVEITTQGGAVLVCSVTTPFNLKTATSDLDPEHSVLAPDLLNHDVLVDNYGDVDWDRVVSVKHVGEREVVPISFGGRSFPAGRNHNKRIYSHNMLKPVQ